MHLPFLTPNSRSVVCAGVSLNVHSFIHSRWGVRLLLLSFYPALSLVFLSCALSLLFLSIFSHFICPSVLNYFSRWVVRLSLLSFYPALSLSPLSLHLLSFYLSFSFELFFTLSSSLPFHFCLCLLSFPFLYYTVSSLFILRSLSPLSLHLLSFYLCFCLLNYFSRWVVHLSLLSFYPALSLSSFSLSSLILFVLFF